MCFSAWGRKKPLGRANHLGDQPRARAAVGLERPRSLPASAEALRLTWRSGVAGMRFELVLVVVALGTGRNLTRSLHRERAALLAASHADCKVSATLAPGALRAWSRAAP